MSSYVLEITGAMRRFAEDRGLNDVSLKVAAGEMVALVGPNGAGKTTLMRAAAGRLQLEAGTVRVNGLDPAKDRKARSALGVVPQTIALYPQLTARENLDIFARLLGVKGAAIKKAVNDGLERAGLTSRANDALGELSGGMQRRLNIIAGTLHAPKLLLLDEPTVGVDLPAREAIHGLLEALRDAGMGMLLTTHDLEQAAMLADRVALMVKGSIVEQGSAAELVSKVFGDSKELIVALSKPADTEAEPVLRELVLRPTRDRRIWSGPLTVGYEDLPDIERKLEAENLHVAEIRLRDPGLDSVFLQLTGEVMSS
ncbi:MAG: ABC transporter ATP-binding protein [Gammaproteobacteria bacterium]|nr:ABC transporter ATP-binding protein [Gammaproteobacteria bacterium]